MAHPLYNAASAAHDALLSNLHTFATLMDHSLNVEPTERGIVAYERANAHVRFAIDHLRETFGSRDTIPAPSADDTEEPR
jgi:hypothetical protein